MQTMTYYMFCMLITQMITPRKEHGVVEKARAFWSRRSWAWIQLHDDLNLSRPQFPPLWNGHSGYLPNILQGGDVDEKYQHLVKC